jgi:hypothetical protein
MLTNINGCMHQEKMCIAKEVEQKNYKEESKGEVI